MNQPLITSAPQDRRDQAPSLDEACLSHYDDEALERALKAVNWHPKDVSQFLRSAACR